MSSFLKRAICAVSAVLALSPYCCAQDELRIGTAGHSLPFLHAYVAEAQGWLDTDKMKAKIVPFKAGKDCATALINGELDAAIIGAEHAVTAPTGLVKQLLVLNRVPGWVLVVSPKHRAAITTLANLRGRNLGVTAPGSATDILLTYLLSKAGVSRDEFTPVRAGIETFPEIMRHGGIDAGMAVEPYATTMIEGGDADALIDLRSPAQVKKYLGSLYTGTCLLVRSDVIERNREAIQQLTNALVWACKWLRMASAEDVQSLLPREYTPEPALWKKSYGDYQEVFSPDGRNDVYGLNAVISAQVTFGILRSSDSIQPEILIDDSFWTIANQTPMRPPTPYARKTQFLAGEAGKVILGIILLLILVLVISMARQARAAKAG